MGLIEEKGLLGSGLHVQRVWKSRYGYQAKMLLTIFALNDPALIKSVSNPYKQLQRTGAL